jgi:hypothetical protein
MTCLDVEDGAGVTEAETTVVGRDAGCSVRFMAGLADSRCGVAEIFVPGNGWGFCNGLTAGVTGATGLGVDTGGGATVTRSFAGGTIAFSASPAGFGGTVGVWVAMGFAA